MKVIKRSVCLFLAAGMLFSLAGCKSGDYKAAVKQFKAGEYEAAAESFDALGDYKDSAEQALECRYYEATKLFQDGDFEAAAEIFAGLGDYGDSAEMVLECRYQAALAQYDAGDYEAAREGFMNLGEYKDSNAYYLECTDILYSGWAIGTWKAAIALDDTTIGRFLSESIYLQNIVQSEYYKKCDFHFTITYDMTLTEDGEFDVSISKDTFVNLRDELLRGLENLTYIPFSDLVKLLAGNDKSAETEIEESLEAETSTEAEEATENSADLSEATEEEKGLSTEVIEYIVNKVEPIIEDYLLSYIACDGTYTIQDGNLNLVDGSDTSSFPITMSGTELTLDDALTNHVKCLTWLEAYPQTFSRQG